MKNNLFERCCADIESEYDRLDHRLGWRFLSGPKSNLKKPTRLALITLNPGGNYDPPDHPHESQEQGSAYLVERWDGAMAGQSKLQRQVGEMFVHLAARMGRPDYKALMHNTLAGYFIPFRSSSFVGLQRRADSIAFGCRLWTEIFNHIAPEIVITIDTHSFKHIGAILRAKKRSATERSIQMPTGWGNYMADIVDFDSPSGNVRLVRLPHLSRFGIFGRPQGREAVSKLMDAIAAKV
jgi:hypothetical protein